jgi:predicted TIM-barrel fold metal-dependent hydrolase
MAIDSRMCFTQHDSLGRPFGADGIVKAMDAYRIEAAVLVSSMAVDVDFVQGNTQLLEAIKSNPRLFGCLVVNPAYPAESIEVMRSMMSSPKFVSMGLFQGVSKPHPNIEDSREIINAYRRFAKPILLHAPNAAAVEAAVQIAGEFPGIKFILGSMGGPDWRRTIPYAKELNLVLETSGSFDAEKIEMAVTEFGSHRVLFASDFPASDIAPMLALIQSSGISKDAISEVLGENAKRLFGLGRPSEQESAE